MNGPALAPIAVLLTVTVPLCAEGLPVTSDGLGAEIVSVAPSTRKLMVGDPAGVLTVTVLSPVPALDAIVNVAVTLVSLAALKFDTLTPTPETVTEVAPVRPVPAKVTFTCVPRDAEAGLIDVSVAPRTVNGSVVLVPPGVLTLRLCVPKVALPAITNVAVICVELTTVTPVAVIPLPAVMLVPLVVKFVPVRVTPTLRPRTPEVGLIEERVGVGGFCTLNGTVLEVPFGVVTLMFLAPVAAFAAIANVAVT